MLPCGSAQGTFTAPARLAVQHKHVRHGPTHRLHPGYHILKYQRANIPGCLPTFDALLTRVCCLSVVVHQSFRKGSFRAAAGSCIVTISGPYIGCSLSGKDQ
jgi:hypothetical protein